MLRKNMKSNEKMSIPEDGQNIHYLKFGNMTKTLPASFKTSMFADLGLLYVASHLKCSQLYVSPKI